MDVRSAPDWGHFEDFEEQERGPIMQSVVGLLLAVAMMAGVAGWRLTHQRDAGRAALGAPPAKQAQPVETAPASWEGRWTSTPVLTVWVVATQ